MNVKSALLHGTLKNDIYMSVPEGFENDRRVYKLNKTCGLKQARYCWNITFNLFAKAEQHNIKV